MGSDDRHHKSDGESIIVPAGAHVSMICCDCGLVHNVWPSYDPVTRQVSMMFVRNTDDTKVERRKMRRKKQGVFK
jgi:hypothetical protein